MRGCGSWEGRNGGDEGGSEGNSEGSEVGGKDSGSCDSGREGSGRSGEDWKWGREGGMGVDGRGRRIVGSDRELDGKGRKMGENDG